MKSNVSHLIKIEYTYSKFSIINYLFDNECDILMARYLISDNKMGLNSTHDRPINFSISFDSSIIFSY